MRKLIRWVVLLSLSFGLTFTAMPTPLPVVHAFAAGNIYHGSVGRNVKELQSRLKFLGYYHGRVDSIFGWRTYWAVRRFQYRFGLKIDGIVGPKTKIRLVNATHNWPGYSTTATTGTKTGYPSIRHAAHAKSPTTQANRFYSAPTVSGLSKHDMNLLAHLVNGEARGEPLKGQVAVADVVLHRMKSSKYPNTIAGVIYQPGAFTAASNGQINKPVHKEAMKAVMDAVQGWDPSHGALNYFNPAKTNNAYVWSRPQIIKIGHHIFTK